MIPVKTMDKMIANAQAHRQTVRGWMFAVAPEIGRKLSQYKGFRVVAVEGLAHDTLYFAPRAKVMAMKERAQND
jgi:hypothetical protein